MLTKSARQNQSHKTPTERFANIDALRGLAALLVVFAHTAEIAIQHASTPVAIDTLISSLAHRADLGRIGVIAFFCISGYLIPMTMRGAGVAGAISFAIRRSTRLYPAYWFSLLAILMTLHFGFGQQFSPPTIAASLTLVPDALGFAPIMGHYWTLEVEVAFYILCAIIFLLGLTRSGAVLLSLMLLCFILTGIFDPRVAPHLGLGTGANALVRISLLGLGLMFWASSLRMLREHLMTSRLQRLLVVAVGGFFGGALTLTGLIFLALEITGDLTRQLLGTGFGVSIFLITLKARTAPNFALSLGKWSYSIYLIHPVPLYWFHSLATRGAFGQIEGSIVVPATIVVSGLTILLAACIYRLIEIPAIEWGHAQSREVERRAIVTVTN